MPACHGNPTDHCCWVNTDVVCPNLLIGPEIRAAVDTEIADRKLKGQQRNAARELYEGITHACRVAIKVSAASIESTGALPDRVTFDTARNTHPDYQPIADIWEARGLNRDLCVTYGPLEQQCCFAEPETVNVTKFTGVPVAVRLLRQAGGV